MSKQLSLDDESDLKNRKRRIFSVAFILTPSGQEFLDTYWKMKGYLDVLSEI
ncbi:MAG: hypothetical protein ACYCQJ_09070 [Nitrososphaerales archaeon]